MLEPRISWTDDPATAVAYSAAPADLLQSMARGHGQNSQTAPAEYYDHDFRRRYAAILLRERGI